VSICKVVAKTNAVAELLGSKGAPLLILKGAAPGASFDYALSVAEAKKKWSTITSAAMLFETLFKLVGSSGVEVILCKHPSHLHPAFEFNKRKLSELQQVTLKLTERMQVIVDATNKLESLRTHFVKQWRISDETLEKLKALIPP